MLLAETSGISEQLSGGAAAGILALVVIKCFEAVMAAMRAGRNGLRNIEASGPSESTPGETRLQRQNDEMTLQLGKHGERLARLETATDGLAEQVKSTREDLDRRFDEVLYTLQGITRVRRASAPGRGRGRK